MSDNTNATEIKKLRNEVQVLRDELAIMKRKYEDIIYNLDTDNFSGRFIKEQGDMRAAIEFNAKGIKTKVSNEEFSSQMELTAETIKTKVSQEDAESLKESILTQTATNISTAVTDVTAETDEKLKKYSTIEQTAESIKAAVEESNPDMTGYATTEWTQNEIVSKVNKTFITNLVDDKYETKSNASSNYDELEGSITELESSIEQNANSIKMVVSKNISAKFKNNAKPTADNTDDQQKGMLCQYKSKLYYFNEIDQEWKLYPYADGIKSQFLQTEYGFDLVGDVKIRGDIIGADYDGDDDKSRTVMNSEGLDVYDVVGHKKIGIGCKYDYIGENLHPVITLGIGTGTTANDAGAIVKLGSGLWIGDSSIAKSDCLANYPNGDKILDLSEYNMYSNGIFIDFTKGKIYKYEKGVPSLL